MKKSLTTLFIVLVTVFSAMPEAFAGYCFVTSSGNSSRSSSTLSGIISKTVNAGSDSNCTMKYDDGSGKYIKTIDYTHFSQGIIFETPELDGSVSTITLTSSITIDSYSDLVIGNRSLETLTDSKSEVKDAKNGVSGSYTDDFLVDAGIMSRTQGFVFYGYNEDFVTKAFDDWNDTTKVLYDYGTVTIDAREIEDLPFKCKDAESADVYLRNLIILTSTHSESEVFADTTDTACLKKGGNVTVCEKSKWDEENQKCKGFGFELGPIVPFDPDKFPGWGHGDDDCEDADKVTWYQDSDNDTYGNAAITKEDCDQPSGYVDNADDCDDSTSGGALINPDAVENCTDTIDNNCNELIDCEDSESACASDNACNEIGTEVACDDATDNDGDGYADCEDSDCASDAACYDPETPEDPSLNDDVEEECSDSMDNDEDGSIDCNDSDCKSESVCAEVDADQDGYTASEGDCDDSAGDVNPGEEEICADEIDNNCDGVKDETDACVDPSIDEIDGGAISGQLQGGAGGCGCELGATAAPAAAQALLAMIAMVPMMVTGALRQRARRREEE